MALDIKAASKKASHKAKVSSSTQTVPSMKETGMLETLQAMVPYLILTIRPIWVCGARESTMEEAASKARMGLNMTVSGSMESIMGLGLSCGLMVAHIRENGETVENTGEESSWESMAQYMKVSGKMESSMARESYKTTMAKSIREALVMGG